MIYICDIIICCSYWFIINNDNNNYSNVLLAFYSCKLFIVKFLTKFNFNLKKLLLLILLLLLWWWPWTSFSETFPFALLITAPGCNPWLWCVCVHYLVTTLPPFHTCWSHRHTLLYQTRFSSHKCHNRFRYYLRNQFLLWKNSGHYLQHWSLLCYNCPARKPVNQSTCSTCLGPVKWRGITRQRSVSTESWSACWWRLS